VYDFDGGTRWEDVVDVLDVYGLRYWAYTTWSHREDAHKFRVVLGLDEAVPVADFAVLWGAVRDMMAWDVDRACSDPARLYYVPSCPMGSTPWQAWGDGAALEWRAYMDWAHARSIKTHTPMRPLEIAQRRNEDRATVMDEATRIAFLRCMDRLDPDVAYHSWIRFGAIAKELGLEQQWSTWCSRGQKYVPGEPEKKLRSFRR